MVATVPSDMPSVGGEAFVTLDAAHVLVYHNDVRVEGIPA
jgi:hypothetical protein